MSTSLPPESSSSDVYHVFAFEGFGGFPGRNARPPRDYSAPSRLVAGVSSLSQLLNFWAPLVAQHPTLQWRYYAQNDWIAALNDILLLAGFTPDPGTGPASSARSPNPPTPPPRAGSPSTETLPSMRLSPGTEPRRIRVILLGYSYGADALHQLAHILLRQSAVTGLPPELSTVLEIPLVFTVDPVKKWTTTTPTRASAYGFSKPTAVGRWVNFYQRIDLESIEFSLFGMKRAIWGGSVAQADRELEFSRGDFASRLIYSGGVSNYSATSFARKAHIWIPAQDRVRAALHLELESLLAETSEPTHSVRDPS